MTSLPRISTRSLVFGTSILLLAACRVEDGGLGPEGVDVDRSQSAGASGSDNTPSGTPPRRGNPSPPAMEPAENHDPAPADGGTPANPDASSSSSSTADAQALPDGAAAVVADGAADLGPAAACADLPALPRPFVDLGRGPRSDDMTFDGQGRLVSFDGPHIVRLRRDLSREFVARAVIGNRGGTLRVAPDGLMVVGDYIGDALFALSYDGRRMQPSHEISRPMKMVWGPPDPMGLQGRRLFVSERTGTIARIDVGGQGGSLGEGIVRSGRLPFRPGGLAFSPDFQTLYVGSSDEEDGLFRLDVRPDETLGPAQLAPGSGGVSSVAGMATDVCGHLYVLSEGDPRVRRWKEGQGWQVVADLGEPFLWSLAFGSGRGGWSATALYVQDASGGRLFEIELGVRAAAPSP